LSTKHPVISVTGSSGAGTTNSRHIFDRLFCQLGLANPVIVEGDSFHRYDRMEMRQKVEESQRAGGHFSHFSIEANLLEELEALFRQYAQSGRGKRRYYIHDAKDAKRFGAPPGTFTPWKEIPENTDLLLYEGLHGAVRNGVVDLPRFADLLIGIVPIINLEWMQKIHRDASERGYRPEDVTTTILRRMHDYIHVIIPQFSETDINFQRVPIVDTSNPFDGRGIPTADESLVIIRFRNPKKFNVDFGALLSMIHQSFMSRANTIIIPGGKMQFAMEIILRPILERMISGRDLARES
jgi:phosphoribulokinase